VSAVSEQNGLLDRQTNEGHEGTVLELLYLRRLGMTEPTCGPPGTTWRAYDIELLSASPKLLACGGPEVSDVGGSSFVVEKRAQLHVGWAVIPRSCVGAPKATMLITTRGLGRVHYRELDEDRPLPVCASARIAVMLIDGGGGVVPNKTSR